MFTNMFYPFYVVYDENWVTIRLKLLEGIRNKNIKDLILTRL